MSEYVHEIPTLNLSLTPNISIGMTVSSGKAAQILERAQSAEAHGYLLEQSFFTETVNDQTTEYGFELRPIGARRKAEFKVADLRHASTFLSSFLNFEYIDPEADHHTKIAADFGHYSTAQTVGKLFLNANVRWPETASEELTAFASGVMYSAADDLSYAKELAKSHGYQRTVYAHASRADGVVLETNPIGSCSIGTDGYTFTPEEPVFELQSHNLYTVEQQLICLCGAIAIANADELLQQQG